MKRLLVAMLTLFITTAFASTTVVGHLLTQKACPAYLSKNSKTNPDDLIIPAQKIYALKEINRDNNPDWFRIWVPESSKYPLRWVSADCGVADFKEPGVEHCELSPGKADSYVFAISWQPGFCQTYGYEAGKPECLNLPSTSYQASHFVLHGLWPNQNSCGTHYEFCGTKHEAKFCDYSPVPLSENVANKLKTLMPSYAYGSCLERHEWNKHGSCQGLTSNKYFSLALRLTEEVDQTPFTAYLREHLAKQVKRDVLLSKVRQSFGESAANKLYLGCKNGILVDVYIQLPNDISPNDSLSSLINRAPEQTQYEGCPENIYISDFNSEWTA